MSRIGQKDRRSKTTSSSGDEVPMQIRFGETTVFSGSIVAIQVKIYFDLLVLPSVLCLILLSFLFFFFLFFFQRAKQFSILFFFIHLPPPKGPAK